MMKWLAILAIFLPLETSLGQAPIDVVFNATGPGVEYAARTYREIWVDHGKEIIKAL